MFNVEDFNKNTSLDTVILTTHQVQQIKEIWITVRNKSKDYFIPNDNRCVYLKIFVDEDDLLYNWIFQPAYEIPYTAREVYLDIFSDPVSYRLSTLPHVDELEEVIQQDDHVYLLKRIDCSSSKKKELIISLKNTEIISSKDSITSNKEFPIITLCGSTRFKDDFIKAQKELTLKGNIVLSVGLFGHSGDKEVWEGSNKEMLDRIHKEKIRMSDAIYVINKDGYIGESTKQEIEFAKEFGKEVLYMY